MWLNLTNRNDKGISFGAINQWSYPTLVKWLGLEIDLCKFWFRIDIEIIGYILILWIKY